MTLREVYTLCCKRAGKTDGKILFTYLTNKTIADMLTHPEQNIEVDVTSALKRVETGEPIQYIVGQTEFMSLPFIVSSSVLIPRQDTETLVELAISFLKNKTNAIGLDLCTGSGCIAVSIQKYTDTKMTGLDISAEALKIARKNAELNSVNTSFIEADVRTFCELKELDIVVSNPPYIETAKIAALEKNVTAFEPHLALDGGENGLDFYAHIAQNSYKMLKRGGMLAVEIGYEQGAAVSSILRYHFGNSTVLKDLCGKDRVVYCYKQVN